MLHVDMSWTRLMKILNKEILLPDIEFFSCTDSLTPSLLLKWIYQDRTVSSHVHVS